MQIIIRGQLMYILDIITHKVLQSDIIGVGVGPGSIIVHCKDNQEDACIGIVYSQELCTCVGITGMHIFIQTSIFTTMYVMICHMTH